MTAALFPTRDVNRLLLAAKELLQVIDQAPIRKAALACGAELYEKAGALIDAIAAIETPSATSPHDDLEYVDVSGGCGNFALLRREVK